MDDKFPVNMNKKTKFGLLMMIIGFIILAAQFYWQCHNWDKSQNVFPAVGLILVGHWLIVLSNRPGGKNVRR
jgi:uncharacterized membrane protein